MMILPVDISYITVFIRIYGGITPYKAQKALDVSATFNDLLLLCPISLKPFYFQSLHRLTLNILQLTADTLLLALSCLRPAPKPVSLTLLEVRLFIQ